MSYIVHFSIFSFSSLSPHIPGPTMWFSYFPCWSVFCNIPSSIVYISHIFTFFIVSRRILGPRMCVSHFPCFLFFSPYSRSYTVHFSFATLMSGSCHIPGQTVFVYHFPFFFSFPIHIPGPTVCISPFLRFSVFLAIFQVIQMFVTHFPRFFFLFSHHIPGTTVCISHFFRFSMFLFHISCSKFCVVKGCNICAATRWWWISLCTAVRAQPANVTSPSPGAFAQHLGSLTYLKGAWGSWVLLPVLV